MKEITGKSKLNSNRFPKPINVNEKSIKKNRHIEEEFNEYFTSVGSNLASKIQNTSKTFEDFLFPVEKNMEYRGLTFEEFEKVFKSVKRIRLPDTTILAATSKSKFMMKLVIHYL